MPQGNGLGAHHLGGPSRITGAAMVGRSEIGGVGLSDQLKYGGAGVAGSGVNAQNTGVPGHRSSSYAHRQAPASSNGHNHAS